MCHQLHIVVWTITEQLLWCQVLSDGEERLQGPSLPQLDARLLCLTLLLPALQKPRAVQLPRVRTYCTLLPNSLINEMNQPRGAVLILNSSPSPLRDIEILALFVSCMCHDLDHRGTNNSFQVASVRNYSAVLERLSVNHQKNDSKERKKNKHIKPPKHVALHLHFKKCRLKKDGLVDAQDVASIRAESWACHSGITVCCCICEFSPARR